MTNTRIAYALIAALSLVACGDAGTMNTMNQSADGGASAATPSAQCSNACSRIESCNAMNGGQINTSNCLASCAQNTPSDACFGCFSGPCASSCGEACAQCFFNNCIDLTMPPTTPPQDAGTSGGGGGGGGACGSNTLARDLGANCQSNGTCSTGVCQTNTRNALRSYCTQECQTIADCPCGDDWFCATVPGRGVVVKYCQSRARNGF